MDVTPSALICLILLVLAGPCHPFQNEDAEQLDESNTSTDITNPETKSVDPRWVLDEIFQSILNFVKWNFVGRISVGLLDGIMFVIDPIVSWIIPKGAASSVILSAIYKKLQYLIMYWFHNILFFRTLWY